MHWVHGTAHREATTGHTGAAPRTPHLAAPNSLPQAAGRARFRRGGGGGELGGLGGEEAGLLHCLHPAAPARTQPERVEPPPAPAGSRRWSAAQLSLAQHHRSAEQTELESGALSPEAGNEEGRCCLKRHGPAAPAAAAAASRGKWLAGGTPVNLFKELNPEGI